MMKMWRRVRRRKMMMKRMGAVARRTMDLGSRLSMATLLILMTKRGTETMMRLETKRMTMTMLKMRRRRRRRKAGGRRGNWRERRKEGRRRSLRARSKKTKYNLITCVCLLFVANKENREHLLSYHLFINFLQYSTNRLLIDF